jgi:hypothetical protein
MGVGRSCRCHKMVDLIEVLLMGAESWVNQERRWCGETIEFVTKCQGGKNEIVIRVLEERHLRERGSDHGWICGSVEGQGRGRLWLLRLR